MHFLFLSSIVCGFLLIAISSRAHADGNELVVWDERLATALDQSLHANDPCRHSPYAVFRQTCVKNSLNVTVERSPFDNLTYLDHLAIFINKHRNLNTSKQLLPGVKFKVNLNLTNVYRQEAKAEARLGVRW